MSIIVLVLAVILFIPIILAFSGGALRWRQFEKFDNHNPRTQSAQLEGIGARVYAAQQNAWEASIMLTGSVLVAYLRNVDLQTLGTVGILFLLARILHIVFYVMDLATFRSLAFGVGLAACLYIAFIAPGQ